MKVIETSLKGCYKIETNLFGDQRGFFMESFNKKKLEGTGVDIDIKQINFAKSQKNVLRGLHFQTGEAAQSKLVGVISGSVVDVAVDLRKTSPTYGQYEKMLLDDPSKLFYVPRGFAHGYYTLEDNTIFYYAVDNFYSPQDESGIVYNDTNLNIDWGFGENHPLVSEKDLKLKNFEI